MNTKILFLASAATLALASCSQNKTETTETTTTPSGAEVTTQTTTAVDTLAYRSPAQVLADRISTDLHSADTTVRTKLRQVFYTRGRVLRDIDNKYTTDTTGRYAAIKAANDQAGKSVKSIVTAPEYATYSSNAGGYYSGPYTVLVVSEGARKPSLAQRVGQGSGIKKVDNDADDRKVKFENGAKIKRSDDGSVKIKYADGTKVKVDENGHRTVK